MDDAHALVTARLLSGAGPVQIWKEQSLWNEQSHFGDGVGQRCEDADTVLGVSEVASAPVVCADSVERNYEDKE